MLYESGFGNNCCCGRQIVFVKNNPLKQRPDMLLLASVHETLGSIVQSLL